MATSDNEEGLNLKLVTTAPPWLQATTERMERVARLGRATPAMTMDEQIFLGNKAKKLTLYGSNNSSFPRIYKK